MGFLTQDKTVVGGDQWAQDEALQAYQKQQQAYNTGRTQGLGYTAQAANTLQGNGTDLGMGTQAFDRYRQSRIKDYAGPNNLVQMASVQTPSVAAAQMQQGLGRVQAGNFAQAGAANNSALGIRNALQANARAGADVAVNSGVARATEEAAQQQRILQAAAMENQARAAAVQGVDQNVVQQQQAIQGSAAALGSLGAAQQGVYTGAFQGQQQLGQNVQLTQAQLDADRERENTAAVTNFAGNVVGGAAQAGANMYTGGMARGVGGAR